MNQAVQINSGIRDPYLAVNRAILEETIPQSLARCSSVYESDDIYRCDTGGETKPCCSSPCFTRTISRLNQTLLLLSLLYQNDLKTKPNPAAPLPALPGRSQDQTKPCCSSPCFTRTISRPNQALLLLSLLYQNDLKTKPSPAAPFPALPERSQD